MTWLLIFALVVVLLIAVSVLPRRLREARTGFPWFWITLPLAGFGAALAVYSLVPIGPLSVEYGWTMYEPLGDEVQQQNPYLSTGILWAVVAAVSSGLSAWAWKRDRI